MEQGNQQSPPKQNAVLSWRNLTVRHMGILLQRYTVNDKNELFNEWCLLRKAITENDKRAAKGEKQSYSMNGFSCGPIVYFLTVMSAINEKAQGNALQKPDAMKRLAEKYHLDVFCKYGSDEPDKYNFAYYIGQIVPSQEDRAAECWKRILGYLAGADAPDLLWKAGDIFQWLYGKNAEAYEKDRSENFMDSYEKCLEILDGWWRQENVGHVPCGENLWHCLIGYFQQAESAFTRRAKRRIENGVKQIIFTGAPGTGKTRTAKQIAESMGTPLALGGSERAYTLVQFHPSYDYTDFVEGLRPVQTGETISFVKLDGHFKAFCRAVAEANKKDAEQSVDWIHKKYFFLIDEINRAELSKVFGELMYGLEADKRGARHSMPTQYGNIPTYDLQKPGPLTEKEDVFQNGFFIPPNVIVIGTMNEIDRSVESMDFALRRRFEFMEAVVNVKTLEEAFQSFGGAVAAKGKELAESVDSLNQERKEKGRPYDLDRQYFISQGQFANLPADETTLAGIKNYAWEFRIKHLLREYLRGESEDSIHEFVEACKDKFFKPGEYDAKYNGDES